MNHAEQFEFTGPAGEVSPDEVHVRVTEDTAHAGAEDGNRFGESGWEMSREELWDRDIYPGWQATLLEVGEVPEEPLLIDHLAGSELDTILDISLEGFRDEQRSGMIGSRRAVLETPGEFARFASGRIGRDTIRYPVTIGDSPKLRRT